MKYLAPRHVNVESIVRHQLTATWVSVHSTTFVMTQIIYDLAEKRQYQVGLRDELEEVMQNCGGILTKTDLSKLTKMDSFMRESQRLNPNTIGMRIWGVEVSEITPHAVTPLRLTVEPLTLSTGQTIPAGVPIGCFSMSLNESSELHESPENFDGYRFEKLHQEPGGTVTSGTLDFGLGIHACPVMLSSLMPQLNDRTNDTNIVLFLRKY